MNIELGCASGPGAVVTFRYGGKLVCGHVLPDGGEMCSGLRNGQVIWICPHGDVIGPSRPATHEELRMAGACE